MSESLTADGCPKGGCTDIRTSYHAQGCADTTCRCTNCGYSAENKEHREHLHRYCQGCHYDWLSPTLETPLIEVGSGADDYRVEADCAMRDYDALELDAGIMREALEKIARTVGIVTRVSDGVALRTAPEWTGQGAQRIAVEALAQLKVTT